MTKGNQTFVVPATTIQQWVDEWIGGEPGKEGLCASDYYIARRACQWGADRELKACCEWLEQNQGRWEIPVALRTARRPSNETLNSIALKMVDTIEQMNVVIPEITDTIRRALQENEDDD